LHGRLLFGATCVSDELRPTSLHTGSIGGPTMWAGRSHLAWKDPGAGCR
jgi:hypothetical protein